MVRPWPLALEFFVKNLGPPEENSTKNTSGPLAPSVMTDARVQRPEEEPRLRASAGTEKAEGGRDFPCPRGMSRTCSVPALDVDQGSKKGRRLRE